MQCSCIHTIQDKYDSVLAVDGFTVYGVEGMIVEATTKKPILGAKVGYTDIGSTYPNMMHESRSVPAKGGEDILRSDNLGRVDGEIEVFWGIDVNVDEALREAAADVRSAVLDRAAVEAVNRMQHTFCIDVSKTGYRTWAKLFTSSDCPDRAGRMLVDLGEVQLVPIEAEIQGHP